MDCGRLTGSISCLRGRGRHLLARHHRLCLDSHRAAARLDEDMIERGLQEGAERVMEAVVQPVADDDALALAPGEPRQGRGRRRRTRIFVAGPFGNRGFDAAGPGAPRGGGCGRSRRRGGRRRAISASGVLGVAHEGDNRGSESPGPR